MSAAVVARRSEPPDSLDFFPTPPWATRALCEHVPDVRFALQEAQPSGLVAWEPACGEGHMLETLREYFGRVHGSDVHDYGRGYAVGSFVGQGLDRAECPVRPDWIVTNPPFNLAEDFARRALAEAAQGVALLLRASWMEGVERYRTIFTAVPPTTVAVFVERVPMVKGRWDPAAASATCYAWFVWRHPVGAGTKLVWVPPGQRKALHRSTDVRRFVTSASSPESGPLFAPQPGA